MVREKSSSTQDLADKIRKLMKRGQTKLSADRKYIASQETELFLDTFDRSEVYMHAEMANVPTLEETVAII